MKPRILVVDNDADMVALLRRHLEVEGWSVTAVTGGEDAQTALGRVEEVSVIRPFAGRRGIGHGQVDPVADPELRAEGVRIRRQGQRWCR